MTMKKLTPFSTTPALNYIGVFITFRCNLSCSYCINMPKLYRDRNRVFPSGSYELSPDQWKIALERFPHQEGLPLTLQGGEPTVYWKGEGLAELVNACDHTFDLLTNLVAPPTRTFAMLDFPERIRRKAPYPGIRVSYHPMQMERRWAGKGIETLVDHCREMAQMGFTVSPEKSKSDIGIYMVDHPNNHVTETVRAAVEGTVPFETKEFLGEFEGTLYGTYRYPWSTNLLSSKTWHEPLSCQCKTSEVLIDPLGFIWSCHYYLYYNWSQGIAQRIYPSIARREHRLTENQSLWDGQLAPTGHILDPAFQLEHAFRFHECSQYGYCIGCDTKVKNNRFQSLDDMGQAHTSVSIRNLGFPKALAKKLNKASAYLETGIIRIE